MSKNQKDAKKIIDKIEHKKGIKLTKEQKKIVKKKLVKEKNKTRSRNIIGGLLLALGLGVGVTSMNFSNEHNNLPYKKIKTASEKNNFKDRVKVEVEEKEKQTNKNTKKELEEEEKRVVLENTRIEINNLRTKEAVLNYIKEIYAEEYNESHEKKITANDLELRREEYIIRVYKDINNKGEENIIISVGDKKEKNILKKNESFKNGVITVRNKSKGKEIQNIVGIKEENNEHKYYAVYKPDEKTKKYKSETADRIGEIIDIGMELADSKDETLKTKNVNVNRLVEKIAEYKLEKTNGMLYEKVEETTISEEIESVR